MTARGATPGTPAVPGDARRPAPFVGYQRLVDACARSGCPVCRCLVDAALGHLRALLAEHVTDPAAWARLAETRGFCAGHAALLRQVPDSALGTAIVYHRLVERAWASLDAVARGGGLSGRRGGWRWLFRARPGADPGLRSRRERCLVCVELAGAEGRYLDALLGGLADADLGVAYAGSPGLCVPHLERALGRPGAGAAAARLGALARASLRRLADDLRRFIDRHDHRAPPGCTPAEAEAWTSALAVVAGRPELFGTQIDRDGGAGRPGGLG